MPNRILKESICRSDQINRLTPFEETLFYRLIVNADDYGRFDGRIAIIKNLLFPLKDGIRAEQIEKAINTLSSVELVERYDVAGKPFVRLTGWDRHQTVRAKKSRYPSPDAPSAHPKTDESICNHLQADASKRHQAHANVPVIQSVSETNPKKNNDDGESRARDPLAISDEEADRYRENLAAIEDGARRIGLPFAPGDLAMIDRLMGEYGADWVLKAIERTQDRNRTWGVVKGILRSWRQKGGIDDGTIGRSGDAVHGAGKNGAGEPFRSLPGATRV